MDVTEMTGGITLDSVKPVQDKPGVARDASGQPLLFEDFRRSSEDYCKKFFCRF